MCLCVQVITLYTGGLDFSGPVEEYFISGGKSVVDTCINLTGFALVGGPASQVGAYVLAKWRGKVCVCFFYKRLDLSNTLDAVTIAIFYGTVGFG